MKTTSATPPVLVAILALFYCLALALLGAKGIVLLTGAMLGCILIYLTALYSDAMLGMVIALIGLSPFFMSVRVIPGLPKLYGDDFILVYLPYMILAYTVLGKKRFRAGDTKILLCMGLFLVAAALSFLSQPIAETALRNFAETYLLGFTLYLIFFNESTDRNVDKFFRVIAVATVLITIYLYLEVAFQKNPLITRYAKLFLDEFLYLDPEIFHRTSAYYRPSAVFFHASEAGTFVAMGLPFVFYSVRNWRFPVRWSLVLFVLGGVILNYTRGVWVALALSILFCNYGKLKRYIPVLAIFGGLALLTIYVTMGDTPFGKRIFDPSNFINRLYYWQIGLNMFIANFPYGFGHINFQNHYMDFAGTAAAPPNLDVQSVSATDSLLLASLVEQGILGFLSLLTFYVVIVKETVGSMRRFGRRRDEKNSLRLLIILHAMLVYLFAGIFADVQLFAKATKLFFIVTGMAFAFGTFAPTGAEEKDSGPAAETAGERP